MTTSTSICSSSVGVRSKTPLRLAAAGRGAGLDLRPALAKVRLAVVTVLKPLRVDGEDRLLGLLAQAEPVDQVALREPVEAGDGEADRVAALGGGEAVRLARPHRLA